MEPEPAANNANKVWPHIQRFRHGEMQVAKWNTAASHHDRRCQADAFQHWAHEAGIFPPALVDTSGDEEYDAGEYYDVDNDSGNEDDGSDSDDDAAASPTAENIVPAAANVTAGSKGKPEKDDDTELIATIGLRLEYGKFRWAAMRKRLAETSGEMIRNSTKANDKSFEEID